MPAHRVLEGVWQFKASGALVFTIRGVYMEIYIYMHMQVYGVCVYSISQAYQHICTKSCMDACMDECMNGWMSFVGFIIRVWFWV